MDGAEDFYETMKIGHETQARKDGRHYVFAEFWVRGEEIEEAERLIREALDLLGPAGA